MGTKEKKKKKGKKGRRKKKCKKGINMTRVPSSASRGDGEENFQTGGLGEIGGGGGGRHSSTLLQGAKINDSLGPPPPG